MVRLRRASSFAVTPNPLERVTGKIRPIKYSISPTDWMPLIKKATAIAKSNQGGHEIKESGHAYIGDSVGEPIPVEAPRLKIAA